MKVLIVDDEPHLIQAIKTLVPWQQFGIDQILSATTTAEARELLLREQPQFAFFDMVIGDDLGTDLMKFVVEKQIASKVIAVSGYSDFKYVRTMLVLGCVDYLLKPLERAALAEAVKKAVDSWNEDRKKTDDTKSLLHQITYLSSEHKHTLLSQLLSPATNHAAFEELMTLSKSFSNAGQCQVLYSDLTFYPIDDDGFRRCFTGFFDALRTDLENRKLGTAILRCWNPHDATVILYGQTDRGLTSVQTAVSHFRRQTGCPFHFGSCSCARTAGEILAAYNSARQAFLDTETNQDERTPIMAAFCHSQTIPAAADGRESQILSALLLNHEHLITQSTAQWLANMHASSPVTYGTIKKISTSFEHHYKDWCSCFAERYPGFTCEGMPHMTPFYLFDEQYHFHEHHALSHYLEILFRLAANLHRVCHSGDVFRQIGDYLEINYNQPFDQAEYASLFHMNKDYLCRKFKEAYGVSMVTRLNEIRIDHGKKLLRSTNAKIVDIAIQIGYNDEKYFIKIFKKFTGMTPNEYRHSNRAPL